MRVVVAACITIVGVVCVLGYPAAAANSSTFQLEITPQKCTLDTLNTGVSQFSALYPEECRLEKEAAHQEAARATGGSSSSVITPHTVVSPPHGTPAGDQGIFENTAVEPLASWLGFGDKNALPVRPMVTSAALLTGTGAIVDAAFFQLRVTRRTWRVVRRSTIKMMRFLLLGAVR